MSRRCAALIRRCSSLARRPAPRWLAAPRPARPTSQRYTVVLDNAFGLTEGADLRAAGVDVGKVEQARRRSADGARAGDGRRRRSRASRGFRARRLLRGQAAVADRRVLPGLRSRARSAAAAPAARSRSSRPPARSRPTSCSTSCAARRASASGSSSPSSATGFAARGDDLRPTIRRAVPALRETDQVLEHPRRQPRARSAQLTRDADTVARRAGRQPPRRRAASSREARRHRRRPPPAARAELRRADPAAARLPARAAPDARATSAPPRGCRRPRCATCAAPRRDLTELLKRLGPFARRRAARRCAALGERVADGHRAP